MTQEFWAAGNALARRISAWICNERATRPAAKRTSQVVNVISLRLLNGGRLAPRLSGVANGGEPPSKMNRTGAGSCKHWVKQFHPGAQGCDRRSWGGSGLGLCLSHRPLPLHELVLVNLTIPQSEQQFAVLQNIGFECPPISAGNGSASQNFNTEGRAFESRRAYQFLTQCLSEIQPSSCPGGTR